MTIEEAIKNADAQFTEAFNQGDTATLIGLYAEDALLLSPGIPEVRGREAIMAGQLTTRKAAIAKMLELCGN